MKRITYLFLIFTAMLIMLPLPATGAPVGKITYVIGKVDITTPGQPARPAKIGDDLNVGDVVRSKSNSKAGIEFIDGSILRLASSTRIQINQYMVKEKQRVGRFQLFRGKLQGIVQRVAGITFGKKLANQFEVHTPTAVCGVRGTNFFTWHKEGKSGSAFQKGEGYMYPQNKPEFLLNVETGQAATVESADDRPVIRPATDIELEGHLDDTAPPSEEEVEEEVEEAKEEAKEEVAEVVEKVKEEVEDEVGEEVVEEVVKEVVADIGEELGGGTIEEVGETIVENVEGTIEETIVKASGTSTIENVVSDIFIDTREIPGSPFTFTTFSVVLKEANNPLGFLASGTLSGEVQDPLPDITVQDPDTNQGPLSLSGPLASVPQPLSTDTGTFSGTMDDGSAFQGYLGGVAGSWEGLMATIMLNPTGEAGYFYGSLDGLLDGLGVDDVFSASGTAYRSDTLGSVSLAGETPESALPNLLMQQTVPLPLFSNIAAGMPYVSAPPTMGTGLFLQTGGDGSNIRWLGVWSETSSGFFTNPQGLG
ncbi:FecR domain-containing protein, partial [Thermodesulfobacteriota bacterium]